MDLLRLSKDFSFINIHAPYNEIEKYVNHLPQDRDAKIVLYCRSGPLSAAASKTLVEMGYTKVIDVEGGMKAWQAAGYELLYRSK